MKRMKVAIAGLLFLVFSCKSNIFPNGEMIRLLALTAKKEYNPNNAFCPEAKIAFCDSILQVSNNFSDIATMTFFKGKALLELGDEEQSIRIFQGLLQKIDRYDDEHRKLLLKELAIAYLRLGERTNCLYKHGMESCVFPIQGNGIHLDKTGSLKAIEIYQTLLTMDPTDIESQWLLNIAYMTVGGYPQEVPPPLLIKGLEDDTSSIIKPFIDVAVGVGLNTRNMAGGSIIDDFNNDGYLDMVSSSWSLDEGMHYCRNNANGTFTEISDSSGLGKLTGGLNMMQTDYNNDGFKDIFVLRGAWKKIFGKEPNSLLRNNGDGTFTDVTKESGLLSFHPTQTATWNDFNNDGWLDVFIGNESITQIKDINPCELYINNKNGTFTNVAIQSNTNIVAFVKGVTSGDYDNDGWKDIFISTLEEKKVLLKNEGIKDGVPSFRDVTAQSGLGSCQTRTFPTWFWDYDNDGWLDILICSYEFNNSLAYYAGAEALNKPIGNSGKQFLFRNKHDGTFEDISAKTGLNKTAFAMGSNFGDIDNDGYLDFYLGTGNPLYQSLVPNKMFKNEGGKKFIDITGPARVGNLQKGHGVSFADLDNDGDEDIYVDMGGAFVGDAYPNSLFINPGQNENNNWINLYLEGTNSNKVAIGSKIKVTFKENGITRSVYRDVNSGGSFGANPLMQHIGIGSAKMVESIEIKWAGNNSMQVFKNIPPRQTIKLKEGNPSFTKINVIKIDYSVTRTGLIGCGPQ